MTEHDFSDISVHDIAARAEVNRATFYAHFYDKYDLLNQWVQEMFQEKLAKNLPPTTPPSKASLRVLILTVCEFLDSFIGQCHTPKPSDDKAMMLRQVQACVYKTVLTWLRTIPDDQKPYVDEIRAHMVSWSIFGTALQWASESRRRFTPEQLADEMMPLLASACYMLMVQPEGVV